MLNMLTRYFLRVAGGASRPVFYDIDAVYPDLRELENHYDTIRGEVEAILPSKQEIPQYHEADSTRSHISSGEDPDRNWHVLMLYLMGEKPPENRALCPETSRLLDAIPDLYQCFVSILEPLTSVPPHATTYGGYLRYHLPLIVPEERPPTMRVKDQMHTWSEREAILFDDSWDHEVFNECQSIRVILVVDLLRPMPRIADCLNRLTTRCILRPFYGRPVAKNAVVKTPKRALV